MRANIPVTNDLSDISFDEEVKPELSREELLLAKIGLSDGWKLLEEYFEKRISNYREGLFGEDLTGKDTSIIGQRFLSAQAVIREFENVIKEIKNAVENVKELKK